MAIKNIGVNKKICIGCMVCSAVAPNTFRLGKDNKSEVIRSGSDPEENILTAVNSCPVSALKIK